MTTLIKQPSESRVYSINFRALLAPGDALDEVVSLTTDPAAQLTLGTPVVASPRVKVRIEDGVAGTTYQVTCVASTTGGDTLEAEGLLEVVDL